MVTDLTAALVSTGSDTLDCMHCRGRQHSNCMKKGSSPLLQGKSSTILKVAKKLVNGFKAS